MPLAAVSWNVSGGDGALHITATYTNKPSAVDLGAWVSGDLGGSVSDIADGQFSSGGTLSIATQGAAAYYASDSFLTVPEPEATLLPGVIGLVAFGRRCRERRSVPRDRFEKP